MSRELAVLEVPTGVGAIVKATGERDLIPAVFSMVSAIAYVMRAAYTTVPEPVYRRFAGSLVEALKTIIAAVEADDPVAAFDAEYDRQVVLAGQIKDLQ